VEDGRSRDLSSFPVPHVTVWLRINGIDQLKNQLEEITDTVLNAVEAQMEIEIAALLRESQEIVPRRTGGLHDSGYSEVERNDSKITGRVGFSAPHAMEVHENLDVQHAAPTQAKYLVEPLFARAPEVIGRLRAVVRKAVDGEGNDSEA
jgi:hypothetical protein